MPAHRHDTRYTRTPRHVHVASKAEGKRERRESEARFVRVFGAPYPEQERGTLLSLLSLCLCLLRPVCCAYVSLGLLSLLPRSLLAHTPLSVPHSRCVQALGSRFALLPACLPPLANSLSQEPKGFLVVFVSRSLARSFVTPLP